MPLVPRQRVALLLDREPLEKLREGVDGELCDQFLRYYENARFGNKQITQQMYLKFIKVLYEILLHFDEQQLEGEGKKREDDDNGKG